MTDVSDIEHWAASLLDKAYRPPLAPSPKQEAIDMILAFFEDAEEMGIEPDEAKLTLNKEVVGIMPVIEPLKHVLRRVRRNLRARI